jgi:hypothetical protein
MTQESSTDPEVVMDRMEARLAELKREYQTGERQLRELVQQESALRETLLRISGAIQVLEELLPEGPAAPSPDPAANGEAPTVLTVP